MTDDPHPEPLYDDTFSGARWTYGLWYRPVRTGHIPHGWIIFSDRPRHGFAHGTVDYPRELSAAETFTFELVLIGKTPARP